MTGNIKYNKDPKAIEALLRSKEMDLESGVLGKFFGAPTHSPGNIAGLLIFLLIITGILISFIPASLSATDYWTTTIPIITLAMGYLFGKRP